jgi:RNA polymerase sigma factor (TIGR02999 family)
MRGPDVDFEDRAHFLSLSAIVMRRVLVDYARARASDKRIGAKKRVDMEEVAMTVVVEPGAGPERLLDLDRALTRLAVQDPRKGRLMEMVYFGGMEPDEAAMVLQVSLLTIQREIQVSKLWLKAAIQRT